MHYERRTTKMHVLLKCPKQDLRLDDALSHHRISELLEASDVSAHHVVALVAIFLSSIISSMVDALHDLLELRIDLFEGS